MRKIILVIFVMGVPRKDCKTIRQVTAGECTPAGSDIVFVLDRSVIESNFRASLFVLEARSNLFHVGSTIADSHIGMVLFDNVSVIYFDLGNYSTNADVSAAILNAPYGAGNIGTNVSLAMNAAITRVFGMPGDRPKVPNMMVVLTYKNDGSNVAQQHQLSLTRNITTFALGVGDADDMDAWLIQISGDPNNVFVVNDAFQFAFALDNISCLINDAVSTIAPAPSSTVVYPTTGKFKLEFASPYLGPTIPIGSATTPLMTTANTNFIGGKSESWKMPVYAYIIMAALTVLSVTLLLFGIRFWRRKRNIKSIANDSAVAVVDNAYSHFESNLALKRNDLFIKYERELGHGAISNVYAGKLSQKKAKNDISALPVAVKIPSQMNYEEIVQIERELEIMEQLKSHVNILRLVGYVKEPEFLAVVLELAQQTLLTYAKISDASVIRSRQALSILRQITNGMTYLSSLQFIHRDLAARNILLTDNQCAKISDFGLCCRADDEKLYYVEILNRRLPIKWMSPEAIAERKFAEKSDVWSFGVLMYEVYSRGLTPYEAIANHDLRQYLTDGNRLQKPELASDRIYEIMRSCWTADPKERPKFADLHNRLEEILNDKAVQYDYVGASEQ